MSPTANIVQNVYIFKQHFVFLKKYTLGGGVACVALGGAGRAARHFSEIERITRYANVKRWRAAVPRGIFSVKRGKNPNFRPLLLSGRPAFFQRKGAKILLLSAKIPILFPGKGGGRSARSVLP